ncbi:MAG: hypothetical protein Q8N17_27130 [Burkholderiaceae bacterium]|nr:hypothetical protein [Burkholderiaceae bacterium]
MSYVVRLLHVDGLHPAERQGAEEMYALALEDHLGGEIHVRRALLAWQSASERNRGQPLGRMPTPDIDAISRWDHAQQVARAAAMATLHAPYPKAIFEVHLRS